MGQGEGSLLPRYGCCIPSHSPNTCFENHVREIHPRLTTQRSKISATFSLVDGHGAKRGCSAKRTVLSSERLGHSSERTGCSPERPGRSTVNINRATEEELMTLSGINRQTARNIVAYRHQIGAFRRVEDLALVSGVGATRLQDLRCEISVFDQMRFPSDSSSSSGIEMSVFDNASGNGSCQSHTRVSSGSSRVKVNINTANIFQLMKVRGVRQSIAENIVSHREAKGPYGCLDDLIKVKGIRPPLLDLLKSYLVLEDCNLSNGVLSNRDSKQTSKKASDSPETVYGPLDICSNRMGLNSGKLPPNGVLRLATWSLDRCGLEKVENPGVREVVAMTILENGIKLLAVQGISNGLVLQRLCDELNEPSLQAVKSWSRPRGRWKSLSPSVETASDEEIFVLGFLFDSDAGFEFRSVMTSGVCSGCLSMLCFTADVMVSGLEIKIANFQISCQFPFPVSEFDTIEDLIRTHVKSNPGMNFIFVGEFLASSDSKVDVLAIFDELRCRPLIPNDAFTDISREHPLGSICTENILVSSAASSLFQGFSGVIRDGLTSPWIPDGWRWGGLVSRHCPVLADLALSGNAPIR